MKQKKYCHFYFDGYSLDEKTLSSVKNMNLFLENINKLFFKNNGKIVLIPYFEGKIKEDGGISGVVLGENSHFTCHTFCYKNTVFIDYFGDQSVHRSVKNLTLDNYKTDDYDLCVNNETLKGNFGKHIIIIPEKVLNFEKAKKLIYTILDKINMTPIHDLIIRKTSEKQFDILQPIAESHISIHRDNDKMVVDVFSCKYFDEKKLLSLLDETENYFEINRGVKFR